MTATALQSLPPPAALQRSRGEALVSLVLAGGRTRLKGLRQAGSAKAMLPRTHGGMPEVVFLNTSGGMTGGDRLDYALTLGPGCRAVATTQTAERAYAAGGGTATLSARFGVGAGGWLDWLPQETILFDGASLDRRTTIDLAADAGCLWLETVVLGRRAMGETVARLMLRDRREIRRAGRPVMVEPLRLDAAALARAEGPAVLGGARAFATLGLVARGAEDATEAVRRVLDEPGVEAAASGFDGRLMLRLFARDFWPLRRQVLRALAVLRPGPPPRVWQA